MLRGTGVAGGLSPQPVNWMEVGEPPTEVMAWRAARLAKAQTYGGLLIGLFIGGAAGFIVLLYWPGAASWSIVSRAELFVAVGIPIGVAEFFVNRVLLTMISRATLLHIRRLAIFDGKVYMERVVGGTIERPVKDVRVSKTSVVAGWYVVSLPAGRSSLAFFVPPLVGTALNSSLGQ